MQTSELMYNERKAARRIHTKNVSNTYSMSIVTSIIIIIIKKLAMQGWERAINTLSVRRPQPTIPTHIMKEQKGKTAGDKKGANS